MDRVAEGHCEGEGAGGVCAKLKLPPFYKVNGKLKRGPLQLYKTLKNGYMFSANELVCFYCLT